MRVYNKYIGCLLIVLSLISFGLKASTQVVNDNDEKNESRKICIKELRRILDAIVNDDKEELSTLFEFPTSNFLFIARTHEVKRILKSNNNKLTKEVYLRCYKSMSKSNYMSLRKVLSSLVLSDLLIHERIFKKIEVKDNECSYFYQIMFQANCVVLSCGSNSNEKYITEDCECSERSVFYYFKLIGNKLKYSHSEIAG